MSDDTATETRYGLIGLLVPSKWRQWVEKTYPKSALAARFGVLLYSFGFLLTGSVIVFNFLKISPGKGLILFIILLLLLSQSLWSYFKRKYRPPLPKRDKFQPVGEDLTDPIRRRIIVGNIYRRIISAESGFLILCGPSGAGKSTIARSLLKDALHDSGWAISDPISGFTSISEFKEAVRKTVEEIGLDCQNKDGMAFTVEPTIAFKNGDPSKNILFIFDQFEQVLEYIGPEPDKNDLSIWFKKLMNSLSQNPSIRCLIIIRKEYFYQLIQLCKEQAHLDDTIDIPGLALSDENNSDDLNDLTARLHYLIPGCVANAIEADFKHDPEILPVEVQMVGFMVQDIVNTKGMISEPDYRTKYGGKRGLIQRYFLRYIDSTSDRETSRALLFALSTGINSRSRYSIDDLAKILHRDAVTIRQSLNDLKRGGLIMGSGMGPYSLPHEYLAEQYHDLSSLLLDPVERDNITHYCELLRRDRMKANSLYIGTLNSNTLIIDMLFGTVFTLLVARLFLPIIPISLEWRSAFGSQSMREYFASISGIIDVEYAPCFIASVLSGFYVWRLSRNFTLKINKRIAFTWVVIISTIAMISFGIFLCHGWLAFASIAGWLVAVQFNMSKSVLRGSWIKIRNDLLSGAAKETFRNMSLITFSGVCLIWSAYFWAKRAVYAELLWGIEIVLAIFFGIFMIICITKHTSKHQGSIFLSTWDRMQNP